MNYKVNYMYCNIFSDSNVMQILYKICYKIVNFVFINLAILQ